jgi:D-sedoheptulose 7-phosphate isomerase
MNKQTILNEINKSFTYKDEFEKLINEHNNIIILGNGGSSAIASHISQDYTKKLNKKSFTFSDSSRLTCYANDYGYQNAYRQFLKEFVDLDKQTLVILISSSGNSENIINCAEFCNEHDQIDVVTLTGFDKDNKLNNLNIKNRKINYWVDSNDYGIVECVHMIFLHMVA